MKYSVQKFTSILAEIQDGATIAETCRKYNISSTTYYNWNNKYATKKTSKPKIPKNTNTKPMGRIVEQALDIQVSGYAIKMTSCTQIRINLQPSSLP
ncbi:transposase [Desulfosporosinus sp. BICA1-9]|uniref:transposase n=1 Tax=Desulfosporosinus sp. BICA1-9 TaxID=1531958 RepID=UPI000A7B5FB3|nr:transposase [Desulfosporosinus sp. BICA1-9]